MKKGKYLNIYILIASASHTHTKSNRMEGIDELIAKACTNCNEKECAAADRKLVLADSDDYQQLFA